MEFPSAPRDIPYSGSGSLMLVSECFGLDAVELVEYFLEGIPEKVELPWRLGLASMEAVDLGNDVTSTLLDDHIGGLAALGT